MPGTRHAECATPGLPLPATPSPGCVRGPRGPPATAEHGPDAEPLCYRAPTSEPPGARVDQPPGCGGEQGSRSQEGRSGSPGRCGRGPRAAASVQTQSSGRKGQRKASPWGGDHQELPFSPAPHPPLSRPAAPAPPRPRALLQGLLPACPAQAQRGAPHPIWGLSPPWRPRASPERCTGVPPTVPRRGTQALPSACFLRLVRSGRAVS